MNITPGSDTESRKNILTSVVGPDNRTFDNLISSPISRGLTDKQFRILVDAELSSRSY